MWFLWFELSGVSLSSGGNQQFNQSISNSLTYSLHTQIMLPFSPLLRSKSGEVIFILLILFWKLQCRDSVKAHENLCGSFRLCIWTSGICVLFATKIGKTKLKLLSELTLKEKCIRITSTLFWVLNERCMEQNDRSVSDSKINKPKCEASECL